MVVTFAWKIENSIVNFFAKNTLEKNYTVSYLLSISAVEQAIVFYTQTQFVEQMANCFFFCLQPPPSSSLRPTPALLRK